MLAGYIDIDFEGIYTGDPARLQNWRFRKHQKRLISRWGYVFTLGVF